MKTEERITKTPENASDGLPAKPPRKPRSKRIIVAALVLLAGLIGAGYYYYLLNHETTEAEIQEIEALIAAGNGEEARALMVSAQQRSAEVDALRLRIGRAFLRDGRLGPATSLLSQVEGSLIKEEKLAIAEYFLGAGDPFSAVRFYEGAMQSGVPRTPILLGRYGEALSLSGNGDAAVAAFREALAADDEMVRVRVDLALTLANLGRLTEARAEALTVLKLDPENDKASRLLDALGSPQ